MTNKKKIFFIVFYFSFNSVKDVFQKISIGEAEILAEICTYHGKLPQGGVTSPYLSNLIMEPIDKKISNFCFKYDLNYTRYADDITISTHLLSKNERERFVKLVIENINNILSEYSFTLNEKKIKAQYAYQQQRVTGIIVNNTMQVPKEYRMKIRQEIYYIKKYGLDSHLMRNHQEKQKYINILKGKINYVLFVNPKDEKMKEYLHYIENHLRY
ncbi:reverse transcriptase family protein [Fusobacterium necrophorum]|uniref:reverse transcriptase family protein n=1 Tax=Fusobacterium necrophorum TaxID=859 RepID=UPI00373AE376